jgi:uncharacterized membrane protein YjjB (DUF3815 family)
VNEIFLQYFLPCLWAFLACAAFCILFNIHAGIFICAAGGALGWLVFIATAPLFRSDLIQVFIAALVISAYSEIMARIRRCPAIGYLVVALFPLVPGGGIYYAMEHAIAGDTDLFLETLFHTLGLSGSLAVGMLMVTSLVRMINNLRYGKGKRN